MKTALTRIALLLITIQGIVNAQVSTSLSRNTKQNSLVPIVEHRTTGVIKERAPMTITHNTVAVTENKLDNLTERISQLDKQIEELMRLKAGLDAEKKEYLVVEQKNNSTITSDIKVNTNSDYVSKIDLLLDLQNEANDLYQKYFSLIKEAKTQQGNIKSQLSSQAKVVLQQYEFKQIHASELAANVTLIKYSENKTTITSLLNDYAGIIFVIKQVNQLTADAEQSIHMAKEIREEAKAQPNNSAKIGAYSNAEEKENIALNKQDEAIKLLEKTAQLHFTILINDLAFN